MESLEKSFEVSLSNDALKGSIIDAGLETTEIAIDHFLNEGLLKEAPIVRYGVLLKDGIVAVHNYFLVKKVIHFLTDAQNKIDLKDRDNFFQNLNHEKKAELAEKTLHLLNQAEDTLKATYLANLLKSLVNKKCTFVEYCRFCFVLQNVYVDDIRKLREHDLRKEMDDLGLLTLLYGYGLTEQVIGADTFTGHPEKKNEYKLAALGEKMLRCLFDE